MWASQDVSPHGEGAKRVRHPVGGLLSLEFSTFAVDGHTDLGLVSFSTPRPMPIATASGA